MEEYLVFYREEESWDLAMLVRYRVLRYNNIRVIVYREYTGMNIIFSHDLCGEYGSENLRMKYYRGFWVFWYSFYSWWDRTTPLHWLTLRWSPWLSQYHNEIVVRWCHLAFFSLFFLCSHIYVDICWLPRGNIPDTSECCPRISPEFSTGLYIFEHLLSTICSNSPKKMIRMKCCYDSTTLWTYIPTNLQYSTVRLLVYDEFLWFLESESILYSILYDAYSTGFPYPWQSHEWNKSWLLMRNTIDKMLNLILQFIESYWTMFWEFFFVIWCNGFR